LRHLAVECNGGNSTAELRDGNFAGRMRIAAVALLVTACGAGTASLDCAFLQQQNCWKTTLAAAAACVPDAGEMGAFAGDRTSCTYPSGAQVVFTDPIPAAPPTNQRWNFTMLAAGAGCIKVEQPADGNYRVTTQAGVVLLGPSGGDEAVVCPDGTVYEGDSNTLSACPGAPDLVPAAAASSNGGAVSLTLLGAQGGPLHVFNCR
jgi:hypothetical protein